METGENEPDTSQPAAASAVGVHEIADGEHGIEMLRRLQNTKWCDIIILGKNASSFGFTGIKAHKIILGAASPYFREAFEAKDFIDSGGEKFRVDQIEHAILQIIIDFIYTSILRVTVTDEASRLRSVLIGADYLLMSKLVHLCGKRLADRYLVNNCAVETWLFGRKYHCEVLESAAVLAMGLNLKALAKQSHYLKLKKEEVIDLLKLLGGKAAESPAKADLVREVAIAWLEYGKVERKVNCDEVMRQVPLQSMSAEALQRLNGTSFLSEHVLWAAKLLHQVRAEGTKKPTVGGHVAVKRGFDTDSDDDGSE